MEYELDPLPPVYPQSSGLVPWTVNYGAGIAGQIEQMRRWLEDTLVPYVNKNLSEWLDADKAEHERLIAAWNAAVVVLELRMTEVESNAADSLALSEAARVAAEAARDLARQYAEDAVEAQDGAIRSLIDTPTSETRVGLDGLYVAVNTFTALADVVESGRLSEATLEGRFELKADLEYVDSAIEDQDAATSGVSARVSGLELLTTAGRLGGLALDARYERIQPQPHAVFIGSSNAVPGTWVEDFAARMGYVAHNYSIGGGSFTGTGAGRYDNQTATAIADESYDKSLVKYFFICDVGNDMRADNAVDAQALVVFANAQNAYPNARIIVLPAVWGNATMNNNFTVLRSVSQRYTELVNASLDFDRVEIIPNTWSWLTGSTTWMRAGEVHPNVAGYARIADFMSKYMHGAQVEFNQGMKFPSPKAAIRSETSYWVCGRNRDLATLQGIVTIPSAVGADTELGQLDYGLWPLQSVRVPVVRDTDRVPGNAFEIFSNGLIRSFGALPSANYSIDVTYRVF